MEERGQAVTGRAVAVLQSRPVERASMNAHR